MKDKHTALDRVATLIADGRSRFSACREAGVHPDTFTRHYNKDQEYRNRVDLAQIIALEEVEEAVKERALAGDIQAQKFLLERLDPDRWSETKRSEVNVNQRVEIDAGRGLQAIEAVKARIEARRLELESGDVLDIPEEDIHDA